MGKSFEATLVQFSSQENFKKAKHILKAGELLCCHEALPGVLRAICRDAKNTVYRVELKGFPMGPYRCSCTCGTEGSFLCAHGMAAALYHAKYTIKSKEAIAVKEGPAQYAGLKFAGLPELLEAVVNPTTAYVEINAESEFPHVPSKWERVPLTVSLKNGKREYFGNLNNLRSLHFNKNLAVALQLSSFPLQDRQIIRYLAINAQQDGTKLTLDAEQCAEFFHCLAGFKNFKRMGEKVVVHREPATPLLLLEKVPRGGYLLKSAVVVNGAPLPLNDVKVITGRAGCWVGMLGEYWWIPAQTDVSWLRNFLRTTIQPCDVKAAQQLLSAENLPIRVMTVDNLSVKKLHFKTLYDAVLRDDGSLCLDLQFDYGGRLCKADQSRFGSSQNGDFWRRNTRAEAVVIQELINFGFRLEADRSGNNKDFSLILQDQEAIGMFVDEVVPRWLREKRDCLLSSGLASLCGDSGKMQIAVKVIASDDQFYELAVKLSAAGLPLRWKDLVQAAVNNEYYMNSAAGFVKIPGKLRLLAGALQQVIYELPHNDEEYPEHDLLKLPRLAALYWAETGADIPGAVPLEFLRLKVEQNILLEELKHPKNVINSELFQAELRPYQQAGVFYLKNMSDRGYNMILADEMGLGKTIQTLALITSDPGERMPVLVLCPTSLVENWIREIKRFTPRLRILEIGGSARKSLWEKCLSYDICICSYALLKRDISYQEKFTFKTLILDEAQHIKNPASANAQTCKRISAEKKLVLTGTPLENSAEDLWSIFDFLHAGLLGTLSSFRAKYAELVKNSDLKKELSRRVAPFILRRKKSDVCLELPEKQEQIVYCEMDDEQRKIYAYFAEKARSCYEEVRNSRGNPKTNGGQLAIFANLLRLRQICCNPSLLPEDFRQEYIQNTGNSLQTETSSKMELLQELLQESIDSGHKVLIFSQFTTMLKSIAATLEQQNIPYEYLDGSTKDRMDRVDSFNQSREIPVFLLSLKAGGVGLNLTSADTVIIYDPWWNPAAEAQAIDRIHRIGQTRNVNSIKLVMKDSVEEKVLELQSRKKELFDSLVEEPGSSLGNMTLEDFEFLLKN